MKNTYISVCMISMGFPPDYTGAGRQALTLAQKLCKRAKLFVVSARSEGLKKKDNLNGVEVVRITTFSKNDRFRINKLSFCLSLFCFLIKNRNKYDIIHCIGGELFLVPSVMLAKLLGKKVVVKLSLVGYTGDDEETRNLFGDDPDAMKKRRLGWLVFQALKRTDAIICISQQLYDICTKNNIGSNKLQKIHNGVDVDFFKMVDDAKRRQIRNKLKLPANSFIACFVGCISKRKRIDLMLEAISSVLPFYPKLFFVIVGPRTTVSKEYLGYIRTIIRRNRLQNNILFTGNVEYSDVKKYLQASDIFLFSSTNEGLPNSLIEAMACGLPCIAADIPAIAELIDPGENGLTYDVANFSKFEGNLTLLLQNKDLAARLGMKARRRILEGYDIRKITEQYISLYEQLLNFKE